MGRQGPLRPSLDRRRFVRRMTAGAAGLVLSRVNRPVVARNILASQAPGAGALVPEGPEPLFDISLAQWSLHQALGAGELDHLDFPGVARREFGIDAVEYVNSFFKDSGRDQGYLLTLKDRCEAEGVRSLLIMCDGEGRIGDPDDAARTTAVENHFRWVEAARPAWVPLDPCQRCQRGKLGRAARPGG